MVPAAGGADLRGGQDAQDALRVLDQGAEPELAAAVGADSEMRQAIDRGAHLATLAPDVDIVRGQIKRCPEFLDATTAVFEILAETLSPS